MRLDPTLARRLLAATILFTLPAQAYVHTRSSLGVFVRWRGQTKLNLVGNPINRSLLSANDISSSAIASLEKWRWASNGSVSFDYWQGTDLSNFPANSEYNGTSSLYFSSNQNGGPPMDPNTIGLTQVWYDTKSGEILEADVSLNDLSFQFTKNPADSTGGLGGANRRVYVENIFTHELGHAFGVGHTQYLQGSMVHSEYFDQAHLSCDEWAGIRSIYGNAHPKGAVIGKILSPAGSGVFGAVVSAISLVRGTVLANAISQPDGSFRIDSLEPGAYVFSVEPYTASGTTLPTFYTNINPRVCNGAPFVRTSLGSGSNPTIVDIGNGTQSDVGHITVKCQSDASTVSKPQTGSPALNDAPTILAGGNSRVAFMDRFANGGGEIFYRMEIPSTRIRLHALSHSLYSPIRVKLELLDSTGNLVSSQSRTQPVYSSESTFQNYDLSLTAEGLTPGVYFLRATAQGLSAFQYPAKAASVDINSFFWVVGATGNATPLLASVLPDNSKCRTSIQSNYSARSGVPPKTQVESASACGTLQDARKSPNFERNSLVNWLLSVALCLGFLWVRRKQALALRR